MRKRLLILAALAAPAFAQPAARELFYVPAAAGPRPKTGKAAAEFKGPPPLGLRAAIEQYVAGSWVEVSPDQVFGSGDAIRISVRANESGFLYISTKGASGRWSVLFPAAEIQGGDNRVEAGRTYRLPSGAGSWRFRGAKGEELVFLVLSRREVRDLDAVLYARRSRQKAQEKEKIAGSKQLNLAHAISAIDDALIGKVRSLAGRDLVFERVDETGENAERARYWVETSGREDAVLVGEFRLLHQ